MYPEQNRRGDQNVSVRSSFKTYSVKNILRSQIFTSDLQCNTYNFCEELQTFLKADNRFSMITAIYSKISCRMF